MTNEGQPQEADDELRARAEDLARRYLDLWQDEMSALAADPVPGEAGRQIVESCIGLSQTGLAWTETFMKMAGQTATPAAREVSQALLTQGVQLSAQWQDMMKKALPPGWPLSSAGANRPEANRADTQETADNRHGAKQQKQAGPTAGNAKGDTPARPAPSAATPERGSSDLDELSHRLALLEERLAAYETGSEDKSGSSGD